jgi:hypothetical protein
MLDGMDKMDMDYFAPVTCGDEQQICIGLRRLRDEMREIEIVSIGAVLTQPFGCKAGRAGHMDSCLEAGNGSLLRGSQPQFPGYGNLAGNFWNFGQFRPRSGSLLTMLRGLSLDVPTHGSRE